MARIGFNLVYLVPGAQGGMETYARELIRELVAATPDHEFISFINRDAAEADGPWHDLTDSIVVPVSARSRVQWVRGEQQLLPPLARRAGVGLLHSFASTAPAWGRYVRVTTIHDLIYRTLPEAHPGLRAIGMRVLVPLAARRSARVIAPSHATARDIVDALGVDRSRIDVVPEGIGGSGSRDPLDEAETRRRVDAGARPIVLSVSAKLAHKNLPRLLQALASIPPPERPLLVLPGYPTPYETELRALAETLGITQDTRFLGWISREQLDGLYAAASGIVFPSLAEGFGLPVLEAMARGTVVACSDIPVLREVAGNAALFFDPRDESAIARAISQLLGDETLRAQLVAAGRERVEHFSWRQAALGTLASYERALESRSRV